MKCIHIFNDTPHHFESLIPFFSSVNADSKFVVFIDGELYNLEPNTLTVKRGEIFNQINISSEIVVHGLWDYKLWYYIFKKGISSKIIWVAWGADIYFNGDRLKVSLKRTLFIFFNFLCVRKFKFIVSLNNGDARLIKEITNHRQIVNCPYPLDNKIEKAAKNNKNDTVINTKTILVGNSGSSTNDHETIFRLLYKYRNEDVKIICPLNYGGDKEYVNKIKKLGHQFFGEKFLALDYVMSQEQYFNLLSKVDILVFNHDRQQGLFNIYYFLFSMKKIYLNDASSTFNELKGMNIFLNKTSSINNLCYSDFVCFDKAINLSNFDNFNAVYSTDVLIKSWSRLINEVCR